MIALLVSVGSPPDPPAPPVALGALPPDGEPCWQCGSLERSACEVCEGRGGEEDWQA